MSKKLKAIKSLRELRSLAAGDERYDRLMKAAAANLGASNGATSDQAYRWLETNANETDEDGVVDEVNACRSMV